MFEKCIPSLGVVVLLYTGWSAPRYFEQGDWFFFGCGVVTAACWVWVFQSMARRASRD